jgi:hypothetical protein
MSRKKSDIDQFGIKEIPCSYCGKDRPVDQFYLNKLGSYAPWCRKCYNVYQNFNKKLDPHRRKMDRYRVDICKSRAAIVHHLKKIKHLENLLERGMQQQSMGKGILPVPSIPKTGLQTATEEAIQRQEDGDQQGVLCPEQGVLQRAS